MFNDEVVLWSLYLGGMPQLAATPGVAYRAEADRIRTNLGLRLRERRIKRGTDMLLAGIALLLALPVMALVALAIEIESPGPLLLRQKRIGEGGKLFTIYKFRATVISAEGVHHSRSDARLTRVGQIIRSTNLEELPQLFNVLEGTLNLVGPRPQLS